MKATQFNNQSALNFSANPRSAASLVIKLKSRHPKPQTAFKQLQATQEALRQKEQQLANAYGTIAQIQQQLQAAQETIREQSALLGGRIEVTDQNLVKQNSIKQPLIQQNLNESPLLQTQPDQTQRLENLGILASGVAHDLNNVLTPILAVVQLLRLQESSLDSRSQELLKVVEDSARRGSDMVQQILTFTKGTSREHSPVAVTPLLQEVINIIQQTFPPSIRLEHRIPEQSLWLVEADLTHLHQVLMNLCVNARDAMPNGGVLTLAVETCHIDQAFAHRNLDAQAGNYLIMTVTDTGTGIPPEVRDRIFEPFFTTKQAGQGTGLGLATVLGIVKTYGGFLRLSSEVGQGTSIQVYLPALETSPDTAIC